MPGCEITTYAVGADGMRCDLHMNCVGLDEVIPRYRNASLVQAIRGKTKPEVMARSRRW